MNVRTTVSSLKESLDCLQRNLNEQPQTPEALMRLSRALKDIDDEVNMLRSFLQMSSNSDAY